MSLLNGYELPSFPTVIMEILQKIRSQDSSAADIAKSLALDPALSVRILSIANSAAFSPIKKIENLTQAIALVGFSQLESLVLSAGVARGMPAQACQYYDPKTFWLASAKRAMLAHELARMICPAKESECFTAAFLQDLALPFLACKKSKEYEPILEKWYLEGGDLAALERQVFDWDHTEVATWICSEWGLPENIALAIKTHHRSSADINYEPLGPVRLVSFIHEDVSSNDGVREMIEEARTGYNISEEKMQTIIESSFEKAEDLAQLIAS